MDSCPSFSIGDTRLSISDPVYFVAELSANHAQDLDVARKSVRAAADAGADAIKLQTYKPETITLDSDKPPFRIDPKGQWEADTLFELYTKAYTPWEWHEELQTVAHDEGLDFFSTAFDNTAVDFLEDLNVPVHKIASFEIVHLPLIRKMARTGKPIIISTGMASLKEIDEAVEVAREAGCDELLLLKCTSSYPANHNEMNLRTIPHLSESFENAVGLSDHTKDNSVPVAAVTLGAVMVEKHFTLSRSLDSPDANFSLTPEQFESMVSACEAARAACGNVHYGPTQGEKSSRMFRRSVFVKESIQAGEILTEDHLALVRPSDGLSPRHYETVLGMRVEQSLTSGMPLTWEAFKA